MTIEELRAAIEAAEARLEAAQRGPFSRERREAEDAYLRAEEAADAMRRLIEGITLSAKERVRSASRRDRAAAEASLRRAEERERAFFSGPEWAALRAAESAAWEAREKISGVEAAIAEVRRLKTELAILRDGPSKPLWWGKDEDGDYVD